MKRLRFYLRKSTSGGLPFEMKTQVDVLQRERDNIIGTQITEEEYNFVNEYRGLILRLKRQ